MNPIVNYGVILEDRATDYEFGAVTGLVHEDRNTTGNWLPFLPSDERQSGRNVDSMACVSFSALNIAEAQINWMIVNKLLPLGTMQFLHENQYLDANGLVNFSDRFTATMSGTTRQGNSVQKVWDSIRKDGLAPEALWPGTLETASWDTFYAESPQHVKDVAKAFLGHFSAYYEYVNQKDIPYALRHAPVQICTAVCSGWGTDDPVQACTQQIAHATMLYGVEQDGRYNDFDSYAPFQKHLAKNYQIPYAYKCVLTPVASDPLKQTFDRDLAYGETSTDVGRLQVMLKVVSKPTNYYGTLTVQAVKHYMARNNIGSWWERNVWPAGARVGPKIRASLNANL